MEYINSLSVTQKLAMIAAAVVLASYKLFGCVSSSCGHHNDLDLIVFFVTLGVCAGTFFLFPKKQEG